jgi:hypothetical protein
MKKQFLLAMAFVFAGFALSAQESLFNKGDKVLNLGIGLGSTLYTGSYYSTRIPPLSASLEYGMIDNLFEVENLNLGLGGYVGFSSSQYKWFGGNYGWNYTYIILGARGALHYPLTEKLDTYTGAMIGPNIIISSEYGDWGDGINTNSASSSGLIFAYYFGARWYFKDNFAVMGEIGYGISYLNLGVALKL